MAINAEKRETFRGYMKRDASYSWIYSPIFISCFLGVVAVLSILSVHQSKQAAIRTYHIQELTHKKRELQRANAKLSCEIARLEALPLIEGRAYKMGLAPAQEVNYVAVTEDRQIAATYDAVSRDAQDTWLQTANIGNDRNITITAISESAWWQDVLAVFTDWTNPPQAAAAQGLE